MLDQDEEGGWLTAWCFQKRTSGDRANDVRSRHLRRGAWCDTDVLLFVVRGRGNGCCRRVVVRIHQALSQTYREKLVEVQPKPGVGDHR